MSDDLLDKDGEPWTPQGEYACVFDGIYCSRCEIYAPQNDCSGLASATCPCDDPWCPTRGRHDDEAGTNP